MHSLREHILQQLIHRPSLTFNELWAHQGESNKFAYHLKILEEDGLVSKSEEKYSLSLEGKKFVAYVEGSTGKVERAPLVIVAAVIYDKEKDHVLMQQRLKEPFYGMWTLPSGKLKADQYLHECARAEVLQETGLECDFSLKGLISTKTYTGDSLSYNHQIFIMRGDNHRGDLERRTREGENRWIERSAIPDLKTFPNMQYNIEIALGKGFRWVEADGKQEEDRFVSLQVLRDERL